MDGRKDGTMDKWMDGPMDPWMDGRMDTLQQLLLRYDVVHMIISDIIMLPRINCSGPMIEVSIIAKEQKHATRCIQLYIYRVSDQLSDGLIFGRLFQ